MKSTINKILIFAVVSLSSFLLGGFVFAQDEIASSSQSTIESIYYTNLDYASITQGTTTSAFEGKIKFAFKAGALKDATIIEIAKINEGMDMPWQLDKISEIYQFDFKNKSAYGTSTSFAIDFKYDKKTNNYKQAFFYDKSNNSWRSLPTKDYPAEMLVKFFISLPYARIAVFDYPNILTSGRASWYKYKGGNFAASPDFSAGSRLRVHNIGNGKFVDVVINDYGPERDKHPDRAIDLDRVAFKKLASLNSGIIDVRIEPLDIKPTNGKILGIAPVGALPDVKLSAKSAIITEEQSGRAIYEKNATSTLPLASLSKIVAIKVFLDTKPTLNKIISYSVKDEEYNYEYANKWESARLRLEEGETLTTEDLIYSSLVGSANNAVETLARASGLARGEFIGKMNETVKNWGAVSTIFFEPTGLSPENVSSVMDYAIITREAMKHPIIEKASKEPVYKFYSTKKNKKKILHKIKNTNSIVNAAEFKIAGSKTGYLDEAGYCLMTRITAPNKVNLIAVTFGTPLREASFNEMKELIRYGIRKIKN